MARLIDDVFKNQKFIPEQMSKFGFQKIEDIYTLSENRGHIYIRREFSR